MSTPSDKTLRLERTKLTPQAPKPGRTALVMSLIAGLAAAVLAYAWLEHQQPAAPPAQVVVQKAVLTPVVVATSDIAARQVITASMVTVQTVDPSKEVNGVEVSLNDVVNQVAVQPIKSGDQVTTAEVQPNVFPVVGMAGMIKDGFRAMTIALNPTSSVAGYIKPGDHVDVVGTFNITDGRTVTRTILQNVLLLATGSEVLQATPDPNATSGNGGLFATGSSDDSSTAASPKQQEVPNATVLVSPIDSEKLVLAGAKGNLTLTLRSDKDDNMSVIPIEDASLLGFHSTAAAPAVAAPPPPPPPAPLPAAPVNIAAPTTQITVIRGGTATQVTVGS